VGGWSRAECVINAAPNTLTKGMNNEKTLLSIHTATILHDGGGIPDSEQSDIFNTGLLLELFDLTKD
jgi:hypothetical protein